MSRFSVTLGDYEIQVMENYQKMRNRIKRSKAVNELIKRGLAKYNCSTDNVMLQIAIREQIGFSIKPFTEYLASQTLKATHMSGRTVYLFFEVMVSGLGNTEDDKEKIKNDAEKMANFSMNKDKKES